MKELVKIFLILVWSFRETNSQAAANTNYDINDEYCGKCPAGYERETRPRPVEGGNGAGGSYDRCGRCVKIDKSCSNGYYPDGNDCKICNCPGPSYDRQFGSSCFRDTDGYPTCTGCRSGTTGRNCEQCTPGSIQNPYYPYDCQIRNDSALCPMGRCPQIYPPPPQPCPGPGPGCDFNYNYVSNYNYRPQNCYGCPSSCLGCGNNCSPNTCSSSCMNCDYRNFPSCPPQTVCPPPPRPWPCPPSRPCPPTPIIQPPPCPSLNCTRCPDVTCPGFPECNPCPQIPPCPSISCPDCNCPGRCPDPCPSCPRCPDIGNNNTVIIQQNITLNIPCLCDPRGTDEAVGWNCMCKNNVAGARCNKCQPGHFGLRLENPNGCSKCYCSGVTDQCESAKYFYSPIFANIVGGNHGFVLTDRMEEYAPGGIRDQDQELWYSYPREIEYTDKVLYWRLPSKFLGNRVTSYGGTLKFSSRFVNSDPNNNGVNTPDIILINGGGNALYWTCRKPFIQNNYKDFEVPLNEDSNWLSLRDSITSRASRWSIMDVLVNLEQILIRASHSTSMRETYLRNVSLESVGSIGWASRVSIEIEKCLCPTGYSGLSCESCGPGYYRDNSGTDKRPVCKLCPCSRKTSLGCYLSDSDKVVCKCKPSYSGQDCRERETLSVSLNPSDVFDCMNREITFTCTFQSSLDLTFEFGTNLQEVVPSIINGSLSKSTRQIKISLSRYLTELTCRILNTQGRTIAQVTSTIVISQESDCIAPITPSPTFIYINIQPSNQICINLGTNKDIICNATTANNQNLQVFWSREGDITGRFRRGISAGVSNRVNIIRITNAQAEDQGGFTCSATDGISVFSQTVTLSIKNLNRTLPYEQNDDPSISKEPFDETQSAQLPAVDRIREYYDNYERERERERKVAQTLPAEIDPSVQIKFDRNNNSINLPVVKITPTSPHMARVGQRVYFECEADGEPSPSVTWSRLLMNGVESTVLSASTPNAVFEISPATKSDEGKYTCTAKNSFGSDQKSLQLIIADPIVCDLSLEYPCKSGDQCILRSNRCDGIKNCKDNSDEHLCQRRTRHLRNFLRRSHQAD